ncbi:zinc finger protein 431-like isoform X2 [Cydia splendana]|uniref:zinc finger protein 431-like isoform X2 n=1 Tax=Cydia splendana TaxID=1100963 RepID=UPI00300CBA73
MDLSTVCRCCLSQGLVKNLYSSYVWLDTTEIYSDMLQGCFNIALAKLENGNICEDCILQLRSAMRFKEQVLVSEREFLKQIQACVDNEKKPFEVKVEPKNELSFDYDSDDYFLADTVPVEVIMPEAREVKKKTPPQKKPLKKEGERARKIRTLVNRLASSMNSCELPDITTLKKKDINEIIKTGRKQPRPSGRTGSGRTVPRDRVNLAALTSWTSRVKTDKNKHRANLQTILTYSNAVPFKNKTLLGFLCGYCEERFIDPVDLRTHTEKDHKKDRLDFKSTFDMTEYNVKLDVGDLNCTLCDEKMDNLSVLKTHLVKVHNKTIYNDIKDHILQFKLKKGDVYDCALCTSTYETFKMLKQHMNKHYANYTCKKCDTAFATKRSLNSHRSTHLEGSHKCPHCDKVFASKSKQHYHVKTKHLGSRNVSNCPFCNEPFRSYYQRNQHLVKVHNSEAKYKCNVCDKAYILKSLLMYHIKKTHLMERNCQCTECGYKFFSKKALNAHMVKHTGERKYSCEVCHKSYARKYTLREHMRIHNNDRRFKCDVCAMTFVQKCSLKSHLLSNHGISMAACDIASTE